MIKNIFEVLALKYVNKQTNVIYDYISTLYLGQKGRSWWINSFVVNRKGVTKLYGTITCDLKVYIKPIKTQKIE